MLKYPGSCPPGSFQNQPQGQTGLMQAIFCSETTTHVMMVACSASLKASLAFACRFIPVYNVETDGAEHLRGGEHGVGDNRLEMAELGGAPPSGAPVGSSTGQLGRCPVRGGAPLHPPELEPLRGLVFWRTWPAPECTSHTQKSDGIGQHDWHCMIC